MDFDLLLLATSDLHTTILNYDYFEDRETLGKGLPYLHSLILDIKKHNKNVMLFDNGDMLQGNPFADYFAKVEPIDGEIETHPMLSAMTSMNYDAIGIGNHEFDYGFDYFMRIANNSTVPMINANLIYKDGKNIFVPYQIIEKQIILKNGSTSTIKVGVISIMPTMILSWNHTLRDFVDVREPLDSAKEFIPEILSQDVDIIVFLSHAGFPCDSNDNMEDLYDYLLSIPQVVAVVVGHVHKKFPKLSYAKIPDYPDIEGVFNNENGTYKGKFFVMPGAGADALGVIKLNFDIVDNQYVLKGGNSSVLSLLDKYGRDYIDPSPAIMDKFLDEHQKVLKFTRNPLGFIDKDVTSYFVLVKNELSIQIVNKAQLWFAKNKLEDTEFKDIPILSATSSFKAGYKGYYIRFLAGDISTKDVANLYKYSNSVAILKLTGKSIKEWLEWNCQIFNTIDKDSRDEQYLFNENFPIHDFDILYGGITYEIDITKPPKYNKNFNPINLSSQRIVNFNYNGVPIKDEDEFMVITNEHKAFTYSIINKDVTVKNSMIFEYENRQTIIDYVRHTKNIPSQVEHVWNFVPISKADNKADNKSDSVNILFRSCTIARRYLHQYPDILYIRDDMDTVQENKAFFRLLL